MPDPKCSQLFERAPVLSRVSFADQLFKRADRKQRLSNLTQRDLSNCLFPIEQNARLPVATAIREPLRLIKTRERPLWLVGQKVGVGEVGVCHDAAWLPEHPF